MHNATPDVIAAPPARTHDFSCACHLEDDAPTGLATLRPCADHADLGALLVAIHGVGLEGRSLAIA